MTAYALACKTTKKQECNADIALASGRWMVKEVNKAHRSVLVSQTIDSMLREVESVDTPMLKTAARLSTADLFYMFVD